MNLCRTLVWIVVALTVGAALLSFVQSAKGSSCGDAGFSYHKAGYWQGRFFPAGHYRWTGSAWELRGRGVHAGFAEYTPFVQRYVAVVPLVDQPTYGTSFLAPLNGFGVAPPTQPATPTLPAPSTPPQPMPPRQEVDLKPVLELLREIKVDTQDLRARQDQLERRVQALEGKPPSAPTPLPPVPEKPKNNDPFNPKPATMPPADDAAAKAFTLVRARCARCHTEGKQAENATLPLITRQGKLLTSLSDTDLLDITTHVTDGTMPPREGGGALSAADRNIMMAWINSFARKKGR